MGKSGHNGLRQCQGRQSPEDPDVAASLGDGRRQKLMGEARMQRKQMGDQREQGLWGGSGYFCK